MMQEVISAHRLPQPYRGLLVGLWIIPIVVLILAIGIGRGMDVALFHPRFLLLLVLMGLPAVYIWQEGIDILITGVRVGVYLPRYYSYDTLGGWAVTQESPAEVIRIWDQHRQLVFSYHTAHLTDFPGLQQALQMYMD